MLTDFGFRSVQLGLKSVMFDVKMIQNWNELWAILDQSWLAGLFAKLYFGTNILKLDPSKRSFPIIRAKSRVMTVMEIPDIIN